eukprot:CAMPEP_0115733906 /NCGR_PEP_ID=MMETSP0272-20121206/85904_1 /TAXON_ID=71861 /ORGANISM="Scrippsiella trochoidea, Strain CCMP3099" /LENGTH=48 /DNA_ID= /DNA_START= /DNA_END= /DNA_ORIENTATION=
MTKQTAPTTTAAMIKEPWEMLSVAFPGKSKAPIPGESFKLRPSVASLL